MILLLLSANIRCFVVRGVFVCLGAIAAWSLATSSASAREHTFRFASRNSGQFFALSTVSSEQEDESADEDADDGPDEDTDDGPDEDTDDGPDEDTDDADDEEDEMNGDDDDDGTPPTPPALLSERTFFSARQLAASLAPGLDAEQNVLGLRANEDSSGSGAAFASAVDSFDLTEDPALAVGVSLQASGLGQTAVPEPSAWILASLGILGFQSMRRRLDGAR